MARIIINKKFYKKEKEKKIEPSDSRYEEKRRGPRMELCGTPPKSCQCGNKIFVIDPKAPVGEVRQTI